MEVYGIVYLITNKINNKIYVGITKHDIQKRFRQHAKDSTNAKRRKGLQSAMAKYGVDNFEVIQICSCFDKTSLMEAERYLISAYQSNKYGYNLTIGGEGLVGFRWLAEQKAKMKIKYSSGNHPMCKFNKLELMQIKSELKSQTIKQVSIQHNCSRETIRGIVTGETYKDNGIDFSQVSNKTKTLSRYKYVYLDTQYNKGYLVRIKGKYYGKFLTEDEAYKHTLLILNAPSPLDEVK